MTYVAEPSPVIDQQLELPIANNRLQLSHFWSTKSIENADGKQRRPQVFDQDSIDQGRLHSTSRSTNGLMPPNEHQASIEVTKDVIQSEGA